MAVSTSAVVDTETISVLFALHENFDLLDFAGPLEAFHWGLQDVKDKCECGFVVARTIV